MRKSVVFILLLFIGYFLSFEATAQKKNNKPNANLIQGDKHFSNLEYYLAANEYARVLKVDSSNAYAMFQLAECYRYYYNYKASEIFYYKVATRFRGAYPLARYWYATMLKDNGNYKKAIEHFERYRNENEDANLETGLYRERALIDIKGCYLAIEQNGKPKKEYGFKCLPEPVNSEDSDYSPVIIENDSCVAITTSRRGYLGIHEDNSLGGAFSDVHRFSKKNDSIWEPVKYAHKDDFEKLNTQYNECSGSFTKDAKKYYFTRCDEIFMVDNYREVNCAIYVSYYKNGKWETPKKLNNNINAPEQWNSQPSVSPDGNILFFVSKRPGGFGMQDIWYSTCNNDDHWGSPVNLGGQVNTLFSDVSPRYYAKEKVLFFSSTGHGGYGALDIFMTREDNGFESCINIGYPFNTNRDDFYFVMGEKKGYVTSNREGGIGNDDIYSFNFKSRKSIIHHIEDSTTAEDEDEEDLEIVKEIREEPIQLLSINKYSNQRFASYSGLLLDSLTKLPAKKVEVKIVDEYGESIAKSITTDKGEYHFNNIPTNKEYQLILKNLDYKHKIYLRPLPEIEYSAVTIVPPIFEQEPEEEKLVVKEFPVTFISKDTMRDKRTFIVKGTIIDTILNTPVSKGQVQLIDEFGNVVQISNLDANGSYKVENVTDTKGYKVIYRVGAKASENFGTSKFQLLFTSNSQVPETTNSLIAIVEKSSFPEAKSIAVDGIILYEDTHQPAADATILLADEDGRALKTSKTDKNGYYKFSNLGEKSIYKIILQQGNLKGNSEERKYLAEKVHVKGSDAEVSKHLFENIYFGFDSYELRSEAKKVLDDLVQYCTGDSTVQIEIYANTDSYGSGQYNKILAANRGKMAMDYMISKGLTQSSMVVNAVGEGKSIAANDTELGRQLNRRVEFYILGATYIESNSVTHIIETNKTIYSLANEYDMTVEELKNLNGLAGDELVAYTPIRVKRRSEDIDIHKQTRLQENNEKLEEELIAKNQALNKNFDPNNAEYRKYIDSIDLAGKGSSYKNNNIGYYNAHSGNTLSNIARLYGVPLEKLKALNTTIIADTFSISQEVKIDYSQKDPAVKGYIINEGNTLEDISLRFELSVKALIEINNLEGYTLGKNMIIRFQKE